MINYTLSQFKGRPWRSLGVALGVALGAALFVGLSALGNGFREAARAPLAGVAADIIITRPAGKPESSPSSQVTRGVRLPFGVTLMSGTDVETMGSTSGVTAVGPALQLWDFGATSYQTVLGLDLTQTTVGPAQGLVKGLLAGRVFQPGERGIAVADRHFAAFFGLKPGSTVTIGEQPFSVVGVAEQKGMSQGAVSNLYVPLADAQSLAGVAPDQVDQVYLKIANAADVDGVVARLTQQLGPVSAITEDSLLQVMGGIGRVSARFAGVAAAVGLVGGLFLTWLALSGLVAERQSEIGVMKAVGWRSNDVSRAFLIEALLLSLGGGLAGLALGWGGAWVLGQIPIPETTATIMQPLPGLSSALPATGVITLPARADWITLGMALLVSVGGGALAGWSGARRAAALKPAQILHQR